MPSRALARLLPRLGTEHLDLYLAHWRDRGADLSVIVTAFENLRAAGKIRAWGVSNFSDSDMEELFHIPNGNRCATNQVPYNISDRRIENDLLPWGEQHGIPVMAYSPLGGPGASLLGDTTLARIGAARGCSAAAVALAWTIRSGNARIRFGGACKRERRCAYPDVHAAGASDARCSVSAAPLDAVPQPLRCAFATANVRFGSLADISECPTDVRFTP